MKFLTHLFDRLTARRAGPIRAAHHSVYVVLLEGVPDGTRKDVYVGMTGLAPEERFANHKRGHKKNYKVMKYGVKLLPELYQDLNPMTYEEACRMEKVLANRLTKQGFNVFGGH
jgi:predicted GIY-YIG superfamily endonuclease